MAKQKTAHAYEIELKKMIKVRTGGDYSPWLLPQIRATANTMVIIDKLQAEIEMLDTMASMNLGSMRQQKVEIDPRVPYYDKMQRTLILQLESLGLNYNSTPRKMTEPAGKGGTDKDALLDVLEDLR